MDILILADFCGNLDGKDNSRFLYLADLLSKDHDVEILTSDFSHGTKSYFENKPISYPFTITMVHEASYKRNVSLRRFYAHYIWGKSVKKYLAHRKRPDVIYTAIPTLTASYFAARYAEKNKIPFVIDIQDLWPEAFKMAFNVPVISDIIFAPFNHIADGIYKRADAVCGVSRTYVERGLKVNKKASGHVVFLGTELFVFDKNIAANPIKKPNDELWLGYCGTLGASYDLNVVIDALSILNDRGVKTPKFIVLGDGERKTEFEQRAKDKSVECLFTGRLPYDIMCGWLSACDIAVNPITHNAAQSIINKHGDYASAGLPVINTQENKEYRDLVDEYQMGFNCKNSDPTDMADKLEKLINNNELRIAMGQGARRCAEERFDRGSTYKELVDLLVGSADK